MCEREQDGRFAASIGSMNTLVLQYISDSKPDDNEPDDNDSSSADDDMRFDLVSEGVQEQVEEFFSQDHMELLLNTYSRYGTSQLKML